MIKRKLSYYLQKSSDMTAQLEIEKLYQFTETETETEDHHNASQFYDYAHTKSALDREIRDLTVTLKQAKDEINKRRKNDGDASTAAEMPRLTHQINGLKESLKTVPPHLTNLSNIPPLLATDTLERTIGSALDASQALLTEEIDLQKTVSREKRLYSELTSLRTLLEMRLRELQDMSHQGASEPDQILSQFQSRIDELNERVDVLKSHIEEVLSGLAAPIIVRTASNLPDGDPLDLEDVTPQLLRLIKALLKELQNPSNSGGYVQISEPYNPLIKFLINGDLITVKPNDPSNIKLRDFGR